MRWIFVVTFSSVCSYLGWWLGDLIGLFGAVILSALGAGIGLYYGRRLAQEYLS